jgi:hypothetical protein
MAWPVRDYPQCPRAEEFISGSLPLKKKIVVHSLKPLSPFQMFNFSKYINFIISRYDVILNKKYV